MRIRWVATFTAVALVLAPVPAQSAPRRTFDIEAHRGGLGLRVESTLAAFGNAVRLGVSTLELDVQITEDGAAVVTPPAETAPREQFVRVTAAEVRAAGRTKRVSIQSFDWGALCASLADECSLRAVYGDPTVRSPWTAGLDWWRFRDLGRLVRASGASTVSANWQVHDPDQPQVPSTDWYLRQDPAYFHGPVVPVLQAGTT